MRLFIAAALLSVLAACASAPTPSAGGWSIGYDPATRLSTATQREPNGQVTATFACQAPSGDLIITDYTLSGASEATVTMGTLSIRVPAHAAGGGLAVALPQRPPILSAVGDNVAMTVAAGGRTHTLAPGAGIKLRDVALACWPQGS